MNVSLIRPDAITLNVSELSVLSVLLASIDSLVVSLEEVGSFLQNLVASDTINANISDLFDAIQVAASTADTLSSGTNESVSISVLLSAIETLTVNLSDLGFFFKEFFGQDTVGTNISESSSIVGLIEASDGIQLSILENKDLVAILVVLDSLYTSLSELAYFFQDLSSQDSIVANVSEDFALFSIIHKVDVLQVQLTYAVSFFKDLFYRDSVAGLSESVHIANFFSTLDTISTNIQESKNLLCQIAKVDSISVNAADTFSDISVSIRIAAIITASVAAIDEP
jgi:hypothetical protein